MTDLTWVVFWIGFGVGIVVAGLADFAIKRMCPTGCELRLIQLPEAA